MKLILLTSWIMVAVVGLAYHFGPGQDKLLHDQIARQLYEAHCRSLVGEYAEAIQLYDQAIANLPEQDREKLLEIRIEKAKVQIEAGATPKAYASLVELAPIVLADDQLPTSLKNELTSALAAAEFYGTWIMRLEGKPKDFWLPFAESSRQRFRHLSESSTAATDSLALYRENLESAIRLERMTIEELQGMPLPAAVSNALAEQSGEGSGDMGKGRGTGAGQGKGKSEGPGSPIDDRDGAGMANPLQRTGS